MPRRRDVMVLRYERASLARSAVCNIAANDPVEAEVSADCRSERTGELVQGVGELLLVTIAEVTPDNPALRRRHGPNVCNRYTPMAPETRG